MRVWQYTRMSSRLSLTEEAQMDGAARHCHIIGRNCVGSSRLIIHSMAHVLVQ